jgi:hypothetical protein
MAKRIRAPNSHALQAKDVQKMKDGERLVAHNVYSLCKRWGEGITCTYAIPIKAGVNNDRRRWRKKVEH